MRRRLLTALFVTLLVTAGVAVGAAGVLRDETSREAGEVNEPTSARNDECRPAVPLVDPEATDEARCLAATLDAWQDSGRYGVGQQLNVSSADFMEPLSSLAAERRPAVVGFDLDELAAAETFDFPRPPLAALLDLAEQGIVLTASWHTGNPGTGLDARDRRWTDLAALLEDTQEAEVFWADYDDKLALLGRLQDGDDGRSAPAAVLFRPLHEANGDWFWWAQADPDAYRALYDALQQRAADAGVHNIVWGWSANARTNSTIVDPLTLLPDRVDLVGIDSYEQVTPETPPADLLDLSGLPELTARVPRTAITEVGPHGSPDGAWDPAVIVRTIEALGLHPSYALLWFDDGDAADGYSGIKQISSLADGPDWLAGCDAGVCELP